MNVYSLCRMFALILTLILAASLLIPLIYPCGMFADLDGTAGIIDHADIWLSSDPMAAIIYGMGDLFCHQEMARSFVVNGSQMPFCIRDVSIILGIVISLVAWEYLQRYVDPLHRMSLISAVILVFIMVADWSVEQYTDFSSPAIRTLTGILAGFGIGTLIKAYCDRSFRNTCGI